MGFDKFFNIAGDKIKKYEHILPDATEVEKRQFESELLVPVALPEYMGQRPTADAIEDLTVRLVFSNEEEVALFMNHFKVSNYVEKSVNDLRLMIGLLELVEQGAINYDAKSGAVTIAAGKANFKRRA